MQRLELPRLFKNSKAIFFSKLVNSNRIHCSAARQELERRGKDSLKAIVGICALRSLRKKPCLVTPGAGCSITSRWRLIRKDPVRRALAMLRAGAGGRRKSFKSRKRNKGGAMSRSCERCWVRKPTKIPDATSVITRRSVLSIRPVVAEEVNGEMCIIVEPALAGSPIVERRLVFSGKRNPEIEFPLYPGGRNAFPKQESILAVGGG